MENLVKRMLRFNAPMHVRMGAARSAVKGLDFELFCRLSPWRSGSAGFALAVDLRNFLHNRWNEELPWTV